MGIRFGLTFTTQGSQQAVQQTNQIGEAAANAVQPFQSLGNSISDLSKILGLNFRQSKEFSQELGLSTQQASKAAIELHNLKAAGKSTEDQFQELSQKLGITREQFDRLSTQMTKASQQSQNAANSIQQATKNGERSGKSWFQTIGDTAFALNNIIGAITTLKDAAQPAYDFLIGANEELNQQLLASQANIAASTRIFKDGLEITDPLEKVQATEGKLRSSLKELEKLTQDISGVTDADTNNIFSTILQDIGELNGQSKVFNDSLDSGTQLAAGFTATLGTLGIPLDEANQEIGSILTGQITSDSLLATALKISSKQVAEWKAQGILVDELNKKFEVFVEANALASRSITGISSNIQSIFEDIGKQAGEPLLEPIINDLAQLEGFLNANKDKILSFSEGAIQKFLVLAKNITDEILKLFDGFWSLEPSLNNILEAGKTGTTLLIDNLHSATIAVVAITRALSPLLHLVTGLVNLGVKWVNTYQNVIHRITGGYKAATEAVQAYSATTEQMGIQNISILKKVKAAIEARQNAEKNGLELTEQQIRKEKAARLLLNGQIEALKEQKKELQGATVVGQENKEELQRNIGALENQIKLLEEQKEAFDSSSSSIELQSKELEDLGDSYEQLESKAENAKRVLEQGANGNLEAATEAAKELLDVTEQQRELGQLSSEQAIKNYEAIARNTKLSYEEQLAAEKAITEVKEQELEHRLDDFAVSTAETEVLIETGEISAIEGEKRLTRIKKKEIELRLEAVKEALEREKALGRGDGDKAQELMTELHQLEAQMAKEIAESQDRLDAAAKKELDEQLQERTTAVETQIAKERQLAATGEVEKRELEKRITEIRKKELEERVKDFEKALKREKKAGVSDERLDELTLEAEKAKAELAELIQEAAEQEYKANLDELEKELEQANQLILDAEVERQLALATARAKGKKRESELNNQRLEDVKKRIESELALEEERIKGLEALQAASPEQAEEREQAIREAKRKTAELQAELIDNQIALEEAARAIIIEGIEREIDLKNQALADESARQELALTKLKSYGAETLVIERERLKNTRERLKKELVLEQNKAKKLAKLKFTSPEQAEANEKAIRDAKRKTTELEAELVNNRLAREENARNVIIEGFKKQVQEQIEANDLLNQSYQRQKSLLDSKSSLLKAQSQLVQTQSQIEIDQINRAIQIQKQLASGEIEDAKVVIALKKELASLGVNAGQSELSLVKQRQVEERRLFEEKQAQIANEIAQKEQTLILETEQNRLQQERLILQAEEAQLQAQLNKLKAEDALKSAIKAGDEKAIEIATGQLEIANKEIALSQRKLENAQAENVVQDKILAQKREQLQIERQTAQERKREDERKLRNKQNLERAKAGGNVNVTNNKDTGTSKRSNSIKNGRKEDARTLAGKFVERQRKNGLADRKISEVTQKLKLPPAQKTAILAELNGFNVKSFPKINLSGGNFSDKNMVGELQGLRKDMRQDLQNLAGIAANRSTSITNNYQSTTRSDHGRTAINSVNL